MSRDHRRLRVFVLADSLVPKIYSISQRFPPAERFGIQVQLRRAAVSVPCNIVEGSARRTTSEYLNFLNIAAGSASEARYLVELSSRLGFVGEEEGEALTAAYTELCASLQALIMSLSREP
jgi:four helix bundle protein